ncbi:MAG: UvrD-helicase domain-containing protein [Desulfobacula sp.]|nr:UvrD-helicase domain-containing protein [Desulfobacula sp.]
MNILFYKDLNISGVTKQYEKTVNFLKNGDFISADVKKMKNTGYYRAKLDYENRLIFKFARYKEQTYILLLEVIRNHNYDKSRFLGGAARIDETKLLAVRNEKDIEKEQQPELTYLNQKASKFHLLDKVISFDNIQEEIFNLNPPVVIIGSAGSGKTVLTLEKIKPLKGNILYATLSPFLVEYSAKLYYSNNYINENQDIDFLSFTEFLETLKIISGKELDYKNFESWLHPRKQSFGIKDSYKLFEEFRGVITGTEITEEFLSKSEYLNLGIKQSIYLSNEREKVYEAFTKYLGFIDQNNFFDLNITSFRWLGYCKPRYDFIIIDEVQDFTNIQLYIILKSLKKQGKFILCGDSNQIVHPNFFSWTNVKNMFYKHDISGSEIKILRTNYRNSIEITRLSNQLLKIKNARFGSIDKESTYLIEPIAENQGEVILYKDSPKIRKLINDKTGKSAKFAIIVMKPDDKKDVKNFFKTPLVFSIHEAKGLEYENIILVNFVSNNSNEFHEITHEITGKQLLGGQLSFSRGRDKSDKALDAYKFYINSLYVGITRTIKNLYILESSIRHNILNLLELTETKKQVEIKQEVSSLEEWENEAKKLELQGKKEQADEIKKTILSIQKTEWEPVTPENLEKLKEDALNPNQFNKRAKDKLFGYSLLYNDIKIIKLLSEHKYRKADNYEKERNSVFRKYYPHYQSDNVKGVEQNIKKYGVDYRDQFNLTPLLAASITGSVKIIEMLTGYGANPGLVDNSGRNPLQILLYRSHFSNLFTAKLGEIYKGFLTENIKIKIDDKLIKIDNRKFEYLLLNYFISLQGAIIGTKNNKLQTAGVEAGDIEATFATYPENILPDYRKKRTYISANLSKNEVDGSNPWNKKLFIRLERGHYALNPNLDILTEEKWKNVYDILRVRKIKKLTPEDKQFIWLNNIKEDILDPDNYTDYDLIKQHNPILAKRLCDLFPEIAEKNRISD